MILDQEKNTLKQMTHESPESQAKMRITGLNQYYGDFQALHDVSLSIPAHKVTALIGPSGCGKSSFIRCLNRMNDTIIGARVEGSLLYDGKDIYQDYDVIELRKRVGMVFQKPNPFPMTVFDNVAYGPRLHGIENRSLLEEIVERSLKNSALWDEVKDRLDRPALGISGGQQQRLCIARALAIDPDVILMDEPTSALDPISTSRIEDLIDELKTRYTIVIVTHNMQQAARISDITAFFYQGVLEESGLTEQVFFNPRKPGTEAYISGKFG